MDEDDGTQIPKLMFDLTQGAALLQPIFIRMVSMVSFVKGLGKICNKLSSVELKFTWLACVQFVQNLAYIISSHLRTEPLCGISVCS